MTQETINDAFEFEVDGIIYVHPDARPSPGGFEAFFNAQPIFDIVDDLESFDEYPDMSPSGSFVWYGPPTTKGLMDD